MTNVDATLKFDCQVVPVREIHRSIRSAFEKNGPLEVCLTNPGARHNLGVAMPSGIRITIEGPAGYYVAGLNDGADVVVRGGVGWGAAESMRDGSIVIEGDAGNAVAASIRSGTVVVRGHASTRAGIAMKGGALIVGGNVGPSAGFMMQKGIVVVCGDAADGVADSMYNGTIYVGGRVGTLGADVVVEDPTAEELDSVKTLLDRWQVHSPLGFRKLVSGRALWNFRKEDLQVWKSAL